MPENSICNEAVYSEEYTDLIIDYSMDEEPDLSELAGACLQIVGYRRAVVYVPGLSKEQLLRNLGYRFIPKCYGFLSMEALEETGVLALRRQPFINLYGKDVLIGIVDDGIDYNNEAFIWEDGRSKIVSAWNQTDRDGTPPNGFIYGSEYSNDEIFGKESLIDKSGHGTAMAAAAAGRMIPDEEFSGVAPDAELVVVKLKEAKQYYRDFYRISEDATAFQENDILLGISYIIQKAEALARPVVIILGVGTNQGDHNGSGFLGEYINSLAVASGTYICTATGNEAANSHHARTSLLNKDEFQDVEINVEGPTIGFSMELWSGAPSVFSLQIKPPIGDFSGVIEARFDEIRQLKFLLNDTVIDIAAEIIERSTGDEFIFMRFTNPAEGIWTVRVINQSNVPGFVDMWLPIKEFIDTTVRFLNPDPDITICEPGNAANVITWAGSELATGGIYINSGRGFTKNGRVKPDLTAPAVSVYTALPASSIRRFGNITGTSMACALGGGMVALIAEWSLTNQSTNSLSAKNILIRGADTEGIIIPDRSFGYGKADIYESFIELGR